MFRHLVQKHAIAVDDATLVRRALSRDGNAFRAIMERCNQRLYRIARSILRNDAEAEDALQEAYLKAFTHLEDFRSESRLSTWLSRIVINEALERVRSERRAASSGAAEAQVLSFPVVGAPDDPEKTVAQHEILTLVERAADALPEKFRIVFAARLIEGMSVEETATLLGLKPKTVKTRLHRARKLVRKSIETQTGPILKGAFPFAGSRCRRMSAMVLRRLGFSD
jgi:RNA polymerase sigma-70 factor, ECF subfamily